MPIYEYKCNECGVEFELLVRGKESPQCPTCGDGEIDRLLSVLQRQKRQPIRYPYAIAQSVPVGVVGRNAEQVIASFDCFPHRSRVP